MLFRSALWAAGTDLDVTNAGHYAINSLRLEKEIGQHEKLVADKDRQLQNEKFMQSAPAHVVESLRVKRAEYQDQLEKSRAALAARG